MLGGVCVEKMLAPTFPSTPICPHVSREKQGLGQDANSKPDRTLIAKEKVMSLPSMSLAEDKEVSSRHGNKSSFSMNMPGQIQNSPRTVLFRWRVSIRHRRD